MKCKKTSGAKIFAPEANCDKNGIESVRNSHAARYAVAALLLLAASVLIKRVAGELFSCLVPSPEITPAQYLLRSCIIYVAAYALPCLTANLLMKRYGVNKIKPAATGTGNLKLSGVAIYTVGATTGILLLNFAVTWISSAFSLSLPERVLPECCSALDFAILFLSLVIFPAMFEELLYRGAAQRLLSPLGATISVVIPSVVFALGHGNALYTVYALLSAVILALLRFKSHNIFPCVICHAVANAVTLFLTL